MFVETDNYCACLLFGHVGALSNMSLSSSVSFAFGFVAASFRRERPENRFQVDSAEILTAVPNPIEINRQ